MHTGTYPQYLPASSMQMDKEMTLKIYENMVKTNIMDNVFHEAQRQVPG